MRGKWAQGMAPRNFAWVIRDQLAVSERLGGYGDSHRRVRRTEEIVWVKAQGFTCVVSILATPHNLHAYTEADLAWRHFPFSAEDDLSTALGALYGDLWAQLAAGGRLLVHHDDVGDHLQGLMAGYLVHTGLVPEETRATAMLELLLQRQMGPEGRALVALAGPHPTRP